MVRIKVKTMDGEVVKDLGVMDERKAERVTRGLLINMDEDNFFVDEEEVT